MVTQNQSFFSFDNNNFLIMRKDFSYNNSATINYGDSICFYYQSTVGLNELISKTKNNNVYPIPSKGTVYLDNDFITSIEVYNEEGKCVTKPNVINKNQIDFYQS